MPVIVDMEACYGCGACELACSLHHAGVFSPELSSIKVLNSMRSGRVSWSIDSTCDSCEGEDEPLCIKYCTYGALRGVK